MCRFEVHSDGHGLHGYREEVLSLTTDFAMGALFGHAVSRPVEDALAAPPPLGHRMPLAAGFREVAQAVGRAVERCDVRLIVTESVPAHYFGAQPAKRASQAAHRIHLTFPQNHCYRA